MTKIKDNPFNLYADEFERDGTIFCIKCKTPRTCEIEFEGEMRVVRTKCKCQKEKEEQETRQKLIEERKRIFREKQKLSMIGEKYLNARFETAKITPNNEQAYKSAKAYTKQAQVVKQNNIGLYIYGDNSSGKTYLTACMCNDLVEQGFTCVFTSIPKLLAEIGRNVREGGLSQAEVIDNLARKTFVFIDDLGKEFLGDKSDYNYSKAEKLLLEVLNARYNNGLPTIFTSNYSLNEFIEKFNLDKAIIERLNEMATRIIKLEGDNFRELALAEKNKIAKQLGI